MQGTKGICSYVAQARRWDYLALNWECIPVVNERFWKHVVSKDRASSNPIT